MSMHFPPLSINCLRNKLITLSQLNWLSKAGLLWMFVKPLNIKHSYLNNRVVCCLFITAVVMLIK